MSDDKPKLETAESQGTITNPLIIVCEHPEDSGKYQIMLGGPPHMTYEHFGLLIADIIRHTAVYKCVDAEQVLEWVHRELESPTTETETLRNPNSPPDGIVH